MSGIEIIVFALKRNTNRRRTIKTQGKIFMFADFSTIDRTVTIGIDVLEKNKNRQILQFWSQRTLYSFRRVPCSLKIRAAFFEL